MRLLVTRPMPDAEETARQIGALGHSVIAEPVSTIAFLAPPELAFAPAAIVLTSRNAARALAKWPTVSGLFDVPVFAVGEATAATARDIGFSAVSAGTGDGEALGERLAGILDPLAGKVLYVAARHRAVDLEARLASEGIAVVTVEAYAAEPVAELGRETRVALASRTLDGVLVFSRRGAAIFGELVKKGGLAEALRDMTIYAISESAAGPLRQFNPAATRIARHPDAKSLLAMIGR